MVISCFQVTIWLKYHWSDINSKNKTTNILCHQRETTLISNLQYAVKERQLQLQPAVFHQSFNYLQWCFLYGVCGFTGWGIKYQYPLKRSYLLYNPVYVLVALPSHLMLNMIMNDNDNGPFDHICRSPSYSRLPNFYRFGRIITHFTQEITAEILFVTLLPVYLVIYTSYLSCNLWTNRKKYETHPHNDITYKNRQLHPYLVRLTMLMSW